VKKRFWAITNDTLFIRGTMSPLSIGKEEMAMFKGVFNKKSIQVLSSVIVAIGVIAIIVALDCKHFELIQTKGIVFLEDEAVPLAGEKIYKYCPTSIDGMVLYCSNEVTPGRVKDGIYYNGNRVLTTSAGKWDSVQVCDPTVVRGNFRFNGNDYSYLMAYLGCATYDCTANEIGFAVSNDLINWEKTGRVVSAVRDGFWGVGQPSLINYNGNIFLFYTSGTAAQTTTYVLQLDCSDLNNVVYMDIKHISCAYDYISNADFAYTDGMIYMTCDTHPFPGGALDFISAEQSVYCAEWDGSIDSMEGLNWQLVSRIGSEITGHERNHNGCFSRDGSGRLSSRMLYVSTADSIGSWSANLYTYRFTTVEF
jgi:hypothetical protein